MSSIRTKMLLWFGLSLGLFMLVFGFTTYSSITSAVIPLTRDLSQEILKARSAEVGRLVRGYLDEVRAIAGSDPIRFGDFAAIGTELAARSHALNPDFEMLFFSDAEGRYVTTKGDTGNVADRDYWQAIMVKGQADAISNPLLSRSSGEPVIVVASAVSNPQGGRVGIIAATVLLKTLSDIVEAITIGGSGAGWIVDRSGLVVAHPNPALRMKLNLLHSSESGYQGLEEIGRTIALGQLGQGTFVRPNGSKVLAIFNPIPHLQGWTFGINLEQSELMERPAKLIRRVAALLAAMLAAVLLIVIALSRTFTASLLRLKEGVDIVSTGQLDHRLEIHTGDEIQELAEAFNRMTTDLKEYIRNLTETTAANERIQSELKVATDIQASLLPRLFPPFPDRPEFDIFAVTDPAKEVGGDFYDFFFIDEHHLCFLIGDVADKGVPAALYMMVAKTLLKSEGQRLGEPAQILTCVNHILSAENTNCMFATAFCAILDTRNGEVRFANAGHNPPLLLDAAGVRYLAVQTGIVLGPMPDAAYTTERIVLQPGDTLFLYTDGVTEAEDAAQAAYGERTLLEALRRGPGADPKAIIQSIRADVMRHVARAPQSDDVTMLALTYRQPQPRAAALPPLTPTA